MVFRAATGTAGSFVTTTVPRKNGCQNCSYVHSSRKHWKCKYCMMDSIMDVFVTKVNFNVGWLVGWLWFNVGTGQLSSFPNFDLLSGTQRHGQLGTLVCRAYPETGTGTSEDVFNFLAIRGPTRGEGKLGLEPGSSDPQSSPLPLRHCSGKF